MEFSATTLARNIRELQNVIERAVVLAGISPAIGQLASSVRRSADRRRDSGLIRAVSNAESHSLSK
jgi:transcriptional regulator with GAF, ATPase, and Fis domain